MRKSTKCAELVSASKSVVCLFFVGLAVFVSQGLFAQQSGVQSTQKKPATVSKPVSAPVPAVSQPAPKPAKKEMKK